MLYRVKKMRPLLVNRIVFKIGVPICLLLTLSVITINHFLQKSVSSFIQHHIEKNAEHYRYEILKTVSSVYQSFLANKKVSDTSAITICKANIVSELESLYIYYQLTGQIFEENALLYSFKEFRDREDQDMSRIQSLDYSSAITFSPWNWKIIVSQNPNNYTNLASMIRTVVFVLFTSFIILLLGLFFLLWRFVLSPLRQIIGPIQEEKTPSYKGIYEFEFLNKSIVQYIARRKELEKKLIGYNENLEVTVRERTKALQQEISENKILDQALRDSEYSYRTLAENLPGIAYRLSLNDHQITFFNNLVCLYTGYTQEELQKGAANQLKNLILPEDRENVLTTISRSVKNHCSFDVEYRLKKKDGEIVFCMERGTVILDSKGKSLCIDGIILDITQRKKMVHALEMEKERLAVTLRSIGDGVITTDTKGKILLINKVAEKLTGWRHEDAVGKRLSEVFNIIHEKTRERCINPFEKVVSSGKIVEMDNQTILVAKDGTQRSITDSGAPIMDKNRKIIGIVLVFRDVTEKNKMETELLKIKKLESVGVLAGGIAHDFNNLLTAIYNNIELAKMLSKPGERVHRLLIQSEKVIQRTTQLTNQLLTFAKGDAPVKKTANIIELIRETATLVMSGSNCTLSIDIQGPVQNLDIDTAQMSRVFQNLILNAQEAMPDGGKISIHSQIITVDADSSLPLNQGEYIKITVSDNGGGIPQEIIGNIFDPYFTTKRMGTQKGQGLGLAICNSILIKHAGYLSVASKPDHGASFYIYLPIATVISEKNSR